ncbi:MAG: hypothetical protein AAGM36_14925, partial [Cyanobacteria bacterium J06597_1]
MKSFEEALLTLQRIVRLSKSGSYQEPLHQLQGQNQIKLPAERSLVTTLLSVASNDPPTLISDCEPTPEISNSSKLRPFAFYHKSHRPPFELTYQKLTSPLLGVIFISSNHT